MKSMAEKRSDSGRVTLSDIARATGVSKSSVSRFLDDRSPPSDSDTARLVRRTAAEMGYVRDVAAASLRRGSTGLIGVIVPRLTDTVMAMLYEAFAKAAARAGRFTIVATTQDDADANRRAIDMLIGRGVDALILCTTRRGDGFPDDLSARGVRFVLALRTDGIHASSVGDDRFGGFLATRHLIDLGHRRIGLIAGPENASNAVGRTEGYRQAMAEAGLEVDPDWIVPSTFDIDSGQLAANRLMRLPSPPTAIFAINDNTAIGALSALTHLNLSVPGDVSVVGYNDIPIVSHLPVPLTTIRTPFDQIATNAIELLADRYPDHEPRIRTATPTLIPRGSTSRV